MTETTTTIECWNVVAGDTGVRPSWDLDCDITVDGVELRGELTMVPGRDGEPCAYGSTADHWMSGGLLSALEAACGDDESRLRQILGDVQATASAVILSSGVAPCAVIS